MMKMQLLALSAVLFAPTIMAQGLFVPGDVIATSSRWVQSGDFPYEVGTIVVFGRDGALKREILAPGSSPLSDPLVRDGVLYVATRSPGAIQRLDSEGYVLAPFATDLLGVNNIAPGPNRGILAVTSADLYQLAADGGRILYVPFHLSAGAGIDLGLDGCTLFSNHGYGLVRWDACHNSSPTWFGLHLGAGGGAIRVLRDGTFIIAVDASPRVFHLDQAGNILRDYGIVATDVALDVDGTSFWTNEYNWIMRVDIASGIVLSRTYYSGGATRGLAVVGEPRVALAGGVNIPTISPALLLLLVVSLATAAHIRLATMYQ